MTRKKKNQKKELNKQITEVASTDEVNDSRIAINTDENIDETENKDTVTNTNSTDDAVLNISQEDFEEKTEEDIEPTSTVEESLKRLSLDDITENEDFIKNENFVPPTNPRKSSNKKTYAIAAGVGAGILVLILIFAFVFRGSFNYGADVNRAKKLAHHYIGYDLVHDNKKNTYGYKLNLYNQDGTTTDSLTFTDALIKPASELNGIYIFDNSKREIKLISASNEDKFSQTAIATVPKDITDKISNFTLNNKFIGLNVKDEIIFTLKESGTIINRLNLKELSLTEEEIEKMFEKSIILENKFFFINNSILYSYDIENNKLDNMDFYRENFSMNVADGKLFIGNKFGNSSNKAYIFAIDPNEFTVENVITLNSSTSTVLKNASIDKYFAVIETSQLESSSQNIFYEVDFKSMIEYELPKEDKDSTKRTEYALANQLYYSQGYMYMANNYTTSTVVKVTDIYTLDQKDITINNDYFIPVIN